MHTDLHRWLALELGRTSDSRGVVPGRLRLPCVLRETRLFKQA